MVARTLGEKNIYRDCLMALGFPFGVGMVRVLESDGGGPHNIMSILNPLN